MEEGSRFMVSLSGVGCFLYGRFCWVIFVFFLVILVKYGLDGRKDVRMVISNFFSDGVEEDSLGDFRLEKLWYKVFFGVCIYLEFVFFRRELRGLLRSFCFVGWFY